ncbi:alpha/beta hydrolase [Nocardia sp. NPDC052112]|uniref:alpha/beta fold hydrolase n=1 Tax=Nocardia sp. NPDC052112 TaxID=3155646 RepID=UPI00341E2D53
MTNNSTSSARLAAPVGGFQEIDGRRVFVHRSGSGGPAVVFLPGASAVGLDYFVVQQRVSRFTTAVVYDRGGTGFSDPLPLPRTATAVATELREVLRAQNIAAPYVLEINPSIATPTIPAWTSSSTTWTPGRSPTNETAANQAT